VIEGLIRPFHVTPVNCSYVIVAEKFRRRLTLFNTQCQFIRIVCAENNDDLFAPFGIATHPMYKGVIVSKRDYLVEVDPRKALERTLGQWPVGCVPLRNIHDIAISSEGSLFLLDRNVKRITKLMKDSGTMDIELIHKIESAERLLVLDDGRLLVSDPLGLKIHILSPLNDHFVFGRERGVAG
jgi:hypothetical protein